MAKKIEPSTLGVKKTPHNAQNMAFSPNLCHQIKTYCAFPEFETTYCDIA